MQLQICNIMLHLAFHNDTYTYLYNELVYAELWKNQYVEES
jgi:hypothetical protein